MHLVNCRLLIVALLLCSSCYHYTLGDSFDAVDIPNPQMGPEPDGECTDCAFTDSLLSDETITPERLRQMRLEVIKQQILQKLRLKEPPKVAKSVLPEPLISGRAIETPVKDDDEDTFDEDEFYGTTQQVIIVPENVDSESCWWPRTNNWERQRSSSCFDFTLTQEVHMRRVTSAKLWLYINDNVESENFVESESQSSGNVTLIVIDVLSHALEGGLTKRVVSFKEINSSQGWVELQLTSAVRSWALRNETTHKLEISCDGCHPDLEPLVSTKQNQKPFLVVHTDSPKGNSKRRKRSVIMCTSKMNTCCVDKFTVNFTEIGWTNWIAAPPTYEANFCKGSCFSDITSTMHRSYSSIVRQYHIKKRDGLMLNMPLPSLCCIPHKMSDLQMIYSNASQNIIINTKLPNMIVESCECV